MAARRQGETDYLARRKGTRSTLPSITVYCEAEKTEYFYFRSLKADSNREHLDLQVIQGDGKLERMLKTAVEHAKDPKRMVRDRDQVWCVIDHDGREGIEAKRLQAVNSNVKVAFSNPCFELWAIYHFVANAGASSCKDLQRLLKSLMPSYDHERGATLDYKKLKPLYDTAKTNAEKSCQDRERDGVPLGKPSTDVYVLVDEILKTRKTPENYPKHQGKF